jgi:hypothetical protein
MVIRALFLWHAKTESFLNRYQLHLNNLMDLIKNGLPWSPEKVEGPLDDYFLESYWCLQL